MGPNVPLLCGLKRSYRANSGFIGMEKGNIRGASLWENGRINGWGKKTDTVIGRSVRFWPRRVPMSEVVLAVY